MPLLLSQLFFCLYDVFCVSLLTFFVGYLHTFLLDSEILKGKDPFFKISSVHYIQHTTNK